ncbi:hypothetical protein FZI85_10450 [Mycobacterium sp. CBMA293]|uniref:hypothetical protein n=1 Tax=unclassified Mycolicibacterium TaxID=2636767 RepID=UPI0012DC9E68|nr:MULTISPECIES: hypothetical protein [unclassified Mycolicibacterium]MUL49301.1 hypothetical protein [Mycolicibacterium sp. CBMA 360]MUL58960.1 hypothetical protein [Mycolicibacterium sp. CBMA 335]MUL69354.1 hypothetical protein [Mycolicibacterium sp. CBMA 311]MUL94318.1 hypothetical protein [Mycolicibacterium sp. CBMA 230]MUM06668.1 hypothetical protein [Mycolicibacterium sp. CBMA 213]
MSRIKNIAKLAVVSAGLGLAALGLGTGVANASPITSGAGIPAWHHDWDGPGWGGGPGWDGGPGWGGPPPPPAWGGGWAPPPPPCISGPLGFVSVCA